MSKILIEVKGKNDEEESELAKLIARGLTQRGYTNITVLVADGIYMDTIADQRYQQTKKSSKGIDKDAPIVTVAKTTYH